jgi:hypothetical protein
MKSRCKHNKIHGGRKREIVDLCYFTCGINASDTCVTGNATHAAGEGNENPSIKVIDADSNYSLLLYKESKTQFGPRH